jgi:hypothetical protein
MSSPKIPKFRQHVISHAPDAPAAHSPDAPAARSPDAPAARSPDAPAARSANATPMQMPNAPSTESKVPDMKDTYDCPGNLNTSDRVLIKLKDIWLHKLVQHNGERFVRGQGTDKKAVQKIQAILTKTKVKQSLAAFPAKALKKWQDKHIRTEWKAKRSTKPPRSFDIADPLVQKWRSLAPAQPKPLPTFLPEDDYEFLVEDVNEGSLDVYLEDADNSGTLSSNSVPVSRRNSSSGEHSLTFPRVTLTKKYDSRLHSTASTHSAASVNPFTMTPRTCVCCLSALNDWKRKPSKPRKH